jgi:hypothetical protein
MLCAARHGRTVPQQTDQARRLLGDPDAVCRRIGQDALNAERAHPLRDKCKDYIAVWALHQARPVGLCHEPQATRPRRVSA